MDIEKLEWVPNPSMNVPAVAGYAVEGSMNIEWLGRAGALVSDTGMAPLEFRGHDLARQSLLACLEGSEDLVNGLVFFVEVTCSCHGSIMPSVATCCQTYAR